MRSMALKTHLKFAPMGETRTEISEALQAVK
jgi:hypothetical protein